MGAFIIMTFVFQSNLYGYWSSTSREVAGHQLLVGSGEYILCFPSVPHMAFALLNCLYFDPWCFFHLIVSLACPAEEVRDRAAWCAPGIQPRSTHHSIFLAPNIGHKEFEIRMVIVRGKGQHIDSTQLESEKWNDPGEPLFL